MFFFQPDLTNIDIGILMFGIIVSPQNIQNHPSTHPNVIEHVFFIWHFWSHTTRKLLDVDCIHVGDVQLIYDFALAFLLPKSHCRHSFQDLRFLLSKVHTCHLGWLARSGPSNGALTMSLVLLSCLGKTNLGKGLATEDLLLNVNPQVVSLAFSC